MNKNQREASVQLIAIPISVVVFLFDVGEFSNRLLTTSSSGQYCGLSSLQL